MTAPATTATSAIPPVTVIVPCFNEEEGLPTLLGRLRAMRRETHTEDWHFLFVDDGSTDNTFSALLLAARDEPWIEVVRLHENLGLGGAVRTGFAHTRSPIVCTIDSDCTYPPERLPELTKLVASGLTDIATASVWHPEGSGAAEGSALRLLMSKIVSRIYKLMVGQDVYTFTCLFRAYRREVISTMPFRANGFAAVAEIMIRALLAGHRIDEVPMPLERRIYGESKIKVSDAIMAHLGLLTVTALAVGARQFQRFFTQLSPRTASSS